MLQAVLIPVRRRAVLLGKKGKVKKKLEDSTKTTVAIHEGDVDIEGETEGVLLASNIVKAIGRGFPPEEAFLLLQEDYHLTVISLQGETGKTIKRLLSRVIGREGRAKQHIERLTGAFLRVQGKTISIIGDSNSLHLASTAVEDLLAGRRHGYVYAKLEKMKRMDEESFKQEKTI